MDEPKRLESEDVRALPYNIRLDLARSTVAGAVAQAQATCDVDDATMALVLEAIVGGLRSNLVQAAAMQCAMASDGTRLVRANGKAARVVPADPPEETTE